MANIKTLSVLSVNDFLDRKILDKCLIALVLLLNGKNSWQTHCMEFCRGQIRERNVIRLGRAGIGRDRAYFSSFVLRSVTVSSRISLSFNLVSRLILHRLQGPGGHTQLDWNICWKHLQCLFLLSPQENKCSAIQILPHIIIAKSIKSSKMVFPVLLICFGLEQIPLWIVFHSTLW